MKKQRTKAVILCFILSFVFIIGTGATDVGNRCVIVGGMPFGVRFQAGEVSVLRTREFYSEGRAVCPAAEAGIRAEDVILQVNGVDIDSMSAFTTAAALADTRPVEMQLRRDGETITAIVTPQKNDEDGALQLGLLLKDSAAGIGTVTYLSADTLRFGGLGHGICDTESGKLLQISNGYITDVTIIGVQRGAVGAPGELKGTLHSEKCGKLLKNCEVGVFGIFTDTHESTSKNTVVASSEFAKEGKAKILCTLEDNRIREYAIEIDKIDRSGDAKTKNFVLRVTDPELLKKTGGIIQGMSGSPILQDGKLVGAVTHVLVNDPTRGYGIFIENMLTEEVSK